MAGKAVKPIPDGYHSVTPFLNVKGVAKLIDFLKSALGAEEVMRMPGPGRHRDACRSEHRKFATDARRADADRRLNQCVLRVRQRRGLDVQTGNRRRRQVSQSADRSVLGRQNGHSVRPVWKYLVDRHAQRGSNSRGDGQADGCRESLDRNYERGILPSEDPSHHFDSIVNFTGEIFDSAGVQTFAMCTDCNMVSIPN